MKGRAFFLFIFFGLFILLELYTYNGLRSLINDVKYQRIFTIGFILQSLFVVFAYYSLYNGTQSGDVVRSANVNFMIGVVFTSFITKLVFCSLMLFQDGGRGIMGLINYGKQVFGSEDFIGKTIPDRRNFLTTGATLIAAIPFTTLLYGLSKGKYKYTIKNIGLSFVDLPKAFDGIKIVQISDIHAGSFDDKVAVMKGIKMINETKPDLILFTGDLVNSDKNEIDPYIDIFSKLEAKHGKYAVLGNHDYYGIRAQRDSADYNEYFKEFGTKFKDLGFDLLKNENRKIEIDGEHISLLGVENWGAGRYFQKYGDLDKSLEGLDPDAFKILMSHDPTHWDEKVVSHAANIQLTLSGHTHGMQFGIDVPWIKWSPVQYRYKRWSGLYEDAKQFLYVNRGFGFLGFPGRIGMWPEITVIELSREVV